MTTQTSSDQTKTQPPVQPQQKPKAYVDYTQQEQDPARLQHRTMQIEIGKQTPGYREYCKKVPKNQRKKHTQPPQPSTPDVKIKCSKRFFEGMVKKWRRDLHWYDPQGWEQEQYLTGAYKPRGPSASQLHAEQQNAQDTQVTGHSKEKGVLETQQARDSSKRAGETPHPTVQAGELPAAETAAASGQSTEVVDSKIQQRQSQGEATVLSKEADATCRKSDAGEQDAPEAHDQNVLSDITTSARVNVAANQPRANVCVAGDGHKGAAVKGDQPVQVLNGQQAARPNRAPASRSGLDASAAPFIPGGRDAPKVPVNCKLVINGEQKSVVSGGKRDTRSVQQQHQAQNGVGKKSDLSHTQKTPTPPQSDPTQKSAARTVASSTDTKTPDGTSTEYPPTGAKPSAAPRKADATSHAIVVTKDDVSSQASDSDIDVSDPPREDKAKHEQFPPVCSIRWADISDEDGDDVSPESTHTHQERATSDTNHAGGTPDSTHSNHVSTTTSIHSEVPTSTDTSTHTTTHPTPTPTIPRLPPDQIVSRQKSFLAQHLARTPPTHTPLHQHHKQQVQQLLGQLGVPKPDAFVSELDKALARRPKGAALRAAHLRDVAVRARSARTAVDGGADARGGEWQDVSLLDYLVGKRREVGVKGGRGRLVQPGGGVRVHVKVGVEGGVHVSLSVAGQQQQQQRSRTQPRTRVSAVSQAHQVVRPKSATRGPMAPTVRAFHPARRSTYAAKLSRPRDNSDVASAPAPTLLYAHAHLARAGAKPSVDNRARAVDSSTHSSSVVRQSRVSTPSTEQCSTVAGLEAVDASRPCSANQRLQSEIGRVGAEGAAAPTDTPLAVQERVRLILAPSTDSNHVSLTVHVAPRIRYTNACLLQYKPLAKSAPRTLVTDLPYKHKLRELLVKYNKRQRNPGRLIAPIPLSADQAAPPSLKFDPAMTMLTSADNWRDPLTCRMVGYGDAKGLPRQLQADAAKSWRQAPRKINPKRLSSVPITNPMFNISTKS